MEVFFFFIYHHNTAPQKAGGQDTHSDCKSPELVCNSGYSHRCHSLHSTALVCLCVGSVCLASHQPWAASGPLSLCCQAGGDKNKPWGFQAHLELGAAPCTEGGREDTQHRIPPMARDTLQLLPHKGFLLSPWQGDVLLQTPQVAGVVFCPQGGTRAILAAVQAHIITYLLFTRETESTHLDR